MIDGEEAVDVSAQIAQRHHLAPATESSSAAAEPTATQEEQIKESPYKLYHMAEDEEDNDDADSKWNEDDGMTESIMSTEEERRFLERLKEGMREGMQADQDKNLC